MRSTLTMLTVALGLAASGWTAQAQSIDASQFAGFAKNWSSQLRGTGIDVSAIGAIAGAPLPGANWCHVGLAMRTCGFASLEQCQAARSGVGGTCIQQ
jgi:hypothetical protein